MVTRWKRATEILRSNRESALKLESFRFCTRDHALRPWTVPKAKVASSILAGGATFKDGETTRKRLRPLRLRHEGGARGWDGTRRDGTLRDVGRGNGWATACPTQTHSGLVDRGALRCLERAMGSKPQYGPG